MRPGKVLSWVRNVGETCDRWWIFVETCTISVSSFHSVTTNTEVAVVTEGSHLLLTCNLSHRTGSEHFQWRKLGFRAWPATASRSAEVSSWKSTLEFPAVSLSDAGAWECGVYGPEGLLGSIQYQLEIAGIPYFCIGLCFSITLA